MPFNATLAPKRGFAQLFLVTLFDGRQKQSAVHVQINTQIYMFWYDNDKKFALHYMNATTFFLMFLQPSVDELHLCTVIIVSLKHRCAAVRKMFTSFVQQSQECCIMVTETPILLRPQVLWGIVNRRTPFIVFFMINVFLRTITENLHGDRKNWIKSNIKRLNKLIYQPGQLTEWY